VLPRVLHRRFRAHLKGGGLVAYPTASCFGLGCDPRNARAVARLLRLKQRPKHKGLILIAATFDQLAPYLLPLDSVSREQVMRRWPGPHTWLLPASNKTSRLVRGRHDKVAVRLDAHPEAVALCRTVDGAIISTSLNRAGREPVRTYREALRQFGRSVLVVPGRVGRYRTPSTIQDFQTGRTYR
jgi:L-threonylcarbamoyladenylate synthase